MATLKVEITEKNGKTKEYEITTSARVAFESAHQTAWHTRIVEEQRESDLWWFAHYLSKKAGEHSLPLDDSYLDKYDGIRLVYDEKNGLTDAE